MIVWMFLYRDTDHRCPCHVCFVRVLYSVRSALTRWLLDWDERGILYLKALTRFQMLQTETTVQNISQEKILSDTCVCCYFIMTCRYTSLLIVDVHRFVFKLNSLWEYYMYIVFQHVCGKIIFFLLFYIFNHLTYCSC